MSGISGINNLAVPAVITPPTTNATTTPAPAKTQTPPNPPYIVELTGTARAKSLQLQGQTPEQISVAMGLSSQIIDGYLSIKPPEPTLIPQPTQYPTTPADLTPSTSASSTTPASTKPATATQPSKTSAPDTQSTATTIQASPTPITATQPTTAPTPTVSTSDSTTTQAPSILTPKLTPKLTTTQPTSGAQLPTAPLPMSWAPVAPGALGAPETQPPLVGLAPPAFLSQQASGTSPPSAATALGI